MTKQGHDEPKAVICLAVYNGRAFLKELLNSLLAQSVQVDIAIRDDASSDDSMNIIRDYSARVSNIHIVENNSNTGSARLNFSMLLQDVVASGQYKYYFFADQDDIWRADKVELLLSKMAELEAEQPNKPILVHSDLEVVDRQLRPIAQSFFSYQGINPFNSSLKTVLVENPASGCAMAFNHQLALLVLPISDKGIMHDWWCSLVAFAVGARIETINEPLVKYRQHSENTLGAKKRGFGQLSHAVLRFRGFDLDRYYEQVSALLASENIELNHDVRRFLEDFTSTQTLGAVARLRFFLKHGIYKSTTVKNVGLLLLTLRR